MYYYWWFNLFFVLLGLSKLRFKILDMLNILHLYFCSCRIPVYGKFWFFNLILLDLKHSSLLYIQWLQCIIEWFLLEAAVKYFTMGALAAAFFCIWFYDILWNYRNFELAQIAQVLTQEGFLSKWKIILIMF